MESESERYREKYVELLVTGYARKLNFSINCIDISLDDILALILQFFSSYHDMSHINLITILYRKCWSSFNFKQGKRTCNWNFNIAPMPNMKNKMLSWSSTEYQAYNISLSSLPLNIANLTTLRCDNWSMIIRSCTCNKRPRGEIYLNVMDNLLNNKPFPRKSYGWKLPNALSGDTTIYNKTKNILYDITLFNVNNTKKHGIFALDFNDCSGYDQWKWEYLKGEYLKYPRVATGSCMIDNDRFIGIMGGAHFGDGQQKRFYKEFELFALNCHKVIQLKSMLNRRLKPCSIYHNKFHKVIVGGGGNIFGGGQEEIVKGIEIYDINKDYWFQQTMVGLMTIGNVGMYDMKISKINPNIIYITLANSPQMVDHDHTLFITNNGTTTDKGGDNQQENVHVLRMDLREDNMHKMLPVVWQHEW